MLRVSDSIRDGIRAIVPRRLRGRFGCKINRGFGISAFFAGDSGAPEKRWRLKCSQARRDSTFNASTCPHQEA